MLQKSKTWGLKWRLVILSQDREGIVSLFQESPFTCQFYYSSSSLQCPTTFDTSCNSNSTAFVDFLTDASLFFLQPSSSQFFLLVSLDHRNHWADHNVLICSASPCSCSYLYCNRSNPSSVCRHFCLSTIKLYEPNFNFPRWSHSSISLFLFHPCLFCFIL